MANSKYTSAIIKGAGLIDETRKLLESWNPDESLRKFAERVQRDGILGHATAHRTSDVVNRVFAPRFLKPTDKPARILKHLLTAGLSAHPFLEMLFVYAARNDPLLYDFTKDVYWKAARRGKLFLHRNDVKSFLTEAYLRGRLLSPWSESVTNRVASGILCMLRDVGYVRETNQHRKEIIRYHMSEQGTAILARELHESGVTDSALCSHPDWGLFGLSAAEVLERLDGLGEHRGVLVQRAGSIVHFTWFVESIEEMIDVLAG